MSDDGDISRRLREARLSFEDERYDDAFNQYSELAQSGDPKAQFFLGFMYEIGHGTGKNIAEALRWYQSGATQDDHHCQRRLGWILAYGDDVHDAAKAKHWYGKAAESGDPECEFDFAEFLALQNDMEAALPWYEKSANQGDALALLRLGYFHSRGIGVKRDKRMAFAYYRRAAEEENVRAQIHYARFLIFGYEGVGAIPRGLALYAKGFVNAVRIFWAHPDDRRVR
jgi:TPR repeat protein